MIFGQTKLELKVGIFVFVGLIILTIFILKIGDFRTAAMGHPVNFVFHFTNGVKTGAPVRFAGVDIGEIKDIVFITSKDQDKTQVRLTGWIRKDVKIPRDSTVWVNTLGLLGEKYIEIMPGKNYADCVVDNDTLVGNDPLAMHELGEIAKNVVMDLDAVIVKIKNNEGTIGKLLSDESLYKELEASIVALRQQLQATIGNVGTNLDGLISDVRANPWKLFWKTKEKPPKK
ncbi:MAG TPA: MlaD family protein [Patescibacteria group bacterium]|nr:MlaD family protein [Patescibacteria group bacterium]